MTKSKKRNVTVQLEEGLLKKSRHLAVDQDLSLSEWISRVIKDAVMRSYSFNSAKRKAFKVLEEPLCLGGKAYAREELHERSARIR